MSTILILDDRSTNRKILAQLAHSVEPGIGVESFGFPKSAIERCREQPPDLVFTDYNMPEMNGAEFTAAFRALPGCADVPVIVVTAYEDRALRYRALEAGATDFLQSPVDHHEFVVRARNFLALRRHALAREQAERASEAKTAFLANMSHELRTPLNAIIGFAEMMGAELLGPLGHKKYKEYATDIVRSADHLRDTIQNVLDIARLEQGTYAIEERKLVSLPPLVHAAEKRVRADAEQGKVRIRVAVPADLGQVVGEQAALGRVVANLLSNAVKFTPPGGTVEVTGVTVNDGVELAFRDTGIGMTAAEIAHAVNRFSQISDDPLRKRYQGAGLGLPIAIGIVEAHGGRLAIESETGKGTVVRVRFPLARAVLRAA
jgi:signal transduction histidine kinase